ncbi:D-glycero-alpha-D-manno-heptose-1,7-bisphosphate 7-phosphatase [Magnetococcales bacterium HHB-1]
MVEENIKNFLLLDRDGVINRNMPDIDGQSNYVLSPDQLEFIPGALDALRRLREAAVKILVVTNQSCIGRGLLRLEELDVIHSKLISEVRRAGGEIDLIYYCKHHPDDNCVCRKPKPGMINAACRDWLFKCNRTWMVGDTVKDTQAAKSANCPAALVLTGHGQEEVKRVKPNVPVFKDLASFVDAYLADYEEGTPFVSPTKLASEIESPAQLAAKKSTTKSTPQEKAPVEPASQEVEPATESASQVTSPDESASEIKSEA